MAPLNTPSSDNSNNGNGFLRRPLSSAALAAALAMGANSPLIAEAQENYVGGVEATTAKTKQQTQELTSEVNLSPDEIRKMKGNRDISIGTDGTKYDPRGNILKIPFGTAANNNRSGIAFNPSATQLGASAFLQENDYRIEGSLGTAINGITDTKAKASFAMLYSGAKLGTQIEVEVGSELYRLAAAQSAIVSGGKVKLSMGFLSKVMKTTFPEYTPETFTPKMQQKSIGLDYTQEFNNNAILKELKTSVVYYDVGNVRLGKIADITVNNKDTYSWSEVDGGVRGGSKLLADVTATFKLDEKVKLEASAGMERVNHNQMFDTPEKTRTRAVAGANLIYQPDSQNRITVGGNVNSASKIITAGYGHKLTSGIETFIEASHIQNTGGLPNENKIMAGIRGTFGGPKTMTGKFDPLWKQYNEPKLNYNDLQPNRNVATSEIQVHEAVTFKDTIVKIDKTALAKGDGLDLNLDNTLNSLHFDNGGFNVISVAGVSDSRYASFLNVSGGKLALVNFKGLNNQLTAEGLQKGATKNLRVSVNDASGVSVYDIVLVKGSVQISTQVNREFNVNATQAAAFLAGNKTIEQIKAEKIDTPTLNIAPTVTKTYNSITLTNNISDADAPVQTILYLLYAADGTFIKSKSTNVFTAADGVLPGTAYKVKTSASALNKNTNKYALYTSPAVDITTDLAPVIDKASTITAPTATKTDTSVTETNTISDADGRRNIMYFLYQADGTTLVASNATGVFTGLAQNTIYKMKTTAETLNATTGVWTLQNSPLGSVTTDVTVDSTPPSTPATLTLSGNAGASAGYTNTQNISLNVADVTDPSGVSWYVSESSSVPAAGAGGWSGTKPTNFALSAGEGAKNIYVFVKDGAGNVQTTGKMTAIFLDTGVPTITGLPAWGTGVASGTSTSKTVAFGDTAGGSPKAISITANNGASITGFSGAYGSRSFNLAAPVNNTGGPVTVTITYSVTDNAGNITTTTQDVDIAPAVNNAPTLSLSLTGAGISIGADSYKRMTGGSLTFDMSGSSDPDAGGFIANYKVEDITNGTTLYSGAGSSFSYANAFIGQWDSGTVPKVVRVTITDNLGATTVKDTSFTLDM